MDETEFKIRSGEVTIDDIPPTSKLDIPADGRNAVVRFGDAETALVGLPKIVRSDFDDGPVNITIGTFNGLLAVEARPAKRPSTAQGTVRNGELELPVDLASALSLFDAASSWGLKKTRTGQTLIGLIEGPAAYVEEEHPHESGVAFSSGDAATTPFTLTVPETAFDAFDVRPPGVLVSCELVDGAPRFVLLPVGEEDLVIPGTSKLVSSSQFTGLLEVQVGGEVGRALGVTDELEITWNETEYGLVGTPQTVPHEF
jgi:hypothetical protein